MPSPQPSRRSLLGGLLAGLVTLGRTAQAANEEQLPSQAKDAAPSAKGAGLPDSTTLTHSASGLPSGLCMNPASAVLTLTWTLSAEGHGVIASG